MADTPDYMNFGSSDEETPSSNASVPDYMNFGSDSEKTPPPAVLPGVSATEYTDPLKPNDYDIVKDWAEKTKNVGFSPETEHLLGMDGSSILGPLNRILTSPALAAQYGMAGLETAADTADAGLSDIAYRTGLNKLLGTSRVNPFNTALEVANAVGPETQLINGGGMVRPNPVTSEEAQANIQNIIRNGGTADDVKNYVKSYGGNPDEVTGLDALESGKRDIAVAIEDNKLNPVVSKPIDTAVPVNPLAQEMGLGRLPNSAGNVPSKPVEEPAVPVAAESEPQLALGDTPSEPSAPNSGAIVPDNEPSASTPVATPEGEVPATQGVVNDKGEVVAPAEQVQDATNRTPEEIDGAVDKVTQQLEAAFKVRSEAESLLQANRQAQAKRLQAAIDEAGENGSDTERLIKMKEALKGKTERPNLPSIRDTIDPEDINRLSGRIMSNPLLKAFEKFRSQNALSKLVDGEILQPNELTLLQRSFPAKMIKSFINNADDLQASAPKGQGNLFKDSETLSTGPIRELNPEPKPVDPDKYVFDKNQGEMFPETRQQTPFKPEKTKPSAVPEKEPSVFTKALSLPRSLMATLDLSAPLRQGVFMVGRKEFYPAFASMFKQFGSKAAFDGVQDAIKGMPNYPLMEKAKLALTEMDGGFTHHEEAFSNDWAGKVPIFGKAHKASERAYTGFLNKLRADSFSNIADKYKEAGIDLNDPANAKALADIGKYVNAATGRGNLPGKWETAAPALSTALFSPRLIASRVALLNPGTYIGLDPIVRKEAVKDLLAFGGIATAVTGLAAAGGAKVETDPRSSDFAKIRVGNTRYDLLGGFGQYLTLGARLAPHAIGGGYSKNSNTGELEDLTTGGYGKKTRLDALTNFSLNKAAPVPSFAIDYLRGKDAVGVPFDARKEIVSRFVPLILQDINEVYRDQGFKGIAMGAPGIFGVGVQTYGNQPQTQTQTTTPDWENFK